MKTKNNLLLLFLAVLMFALCGCSSEENNIVAEPEPEQSSVTSNPVSDSVSDETDKGTYNEIDWDIYITEGEVFGSSAYGTDVYLNEWLNLYCKIPSEYQPSYDLIDSINKINAANKEGFCYEMMALNSEETVILEIDTMPVSNYGTLKEFVLKNYEDLRASFDKVSVNGIKIVCSDDDFSTYSFLGENYLLNARKVETYENDKLARSILYWDLFRIKEDRIIKIQCSAHENQGVDLEDMLSMFTTYTEYKNDILSSAETPTTEDTSLNDGDDTNLPAEDGVSNDG